MSETPAADMLVALQRNLTMVVGRTAIPRFHAKVMARAGVDVERVEAIALGRIADAKRMRVTELAEGLGVACSTAGRHAAKLDEGGLVRRLTDSSDGRATVVQATEAGVDAVQRIRSAHREILSEILADWETSDVEDLTLLLGRLAEALRTVGEPAPALTRS